MLRNQSSSACWRRDMVAHPVNLRPIISIAAGIALATPVTAANIDRDVRPLDPVHWSFVAPKRLDPPAVESKKWVRNSIDAFVLRRLELERLKPSPEATRATLIRRLSFDLTGLPPGPDAVTAFIADDSPGAYERVVDR